jgi:thioredoxin 1
MPTQFECFINTDVPVLVDFYDSRHFNISSLMNMLKSIKKITGNAAFILVINIDTHPYYSSKYQLLTSNTFIIFKKGKIVWRKSGAIVKHELLKYLAMSSIAVQ